MVNEVIPTVICGIFILFSSIISLISIFLIIHLLRKHIIDEYSGKTSSHQINHHLNERTKQEIHSYLKRRKYHQIEKRPELWKKSIGDTKYFIKIDEKENHFRIQYYWKNRLFGNSSFPININLPIIYIIYYRLSRNQRDLKKIYLNSEGDT